MTFDRIEALEMAIAHLEAQVSDLSDICRAQWREIDALRSETGKLTRTLEAFAAEEAEGERPERDRPPPHY